MNFNSKILVTGSAGFLGKRLIHKLCEKGYTNIRCFIRSSQSIQKFNQIKLEFPAVSLEFCEGNLTSQIDAYKAVEGVDYIINCATGKSGPIASMYFDTVVATRNLLEASKTKQLKRIIHISSFAVYGSANLKSPAVINENTPLENNFKRRNDKYSYVKSKQEDIVKLYEEEFNLPVVILRPGYIYGPGGEQISGRVGIQLFGLYLNVGKSNLLPLSYIDNCADAIIQSMVEPGINGEIVNVHDNDLRTCNEFLRRYKKEVKNIKSLKVPYFMFWIISWFIESYSRFSKGQIPSFMTRYRTASIYKKRRFSNEKLVQLLKWEQSVSTDEGLSRHFSYFRNVYMSTDS
jgi:2-alkyl-3-oxoalkanoate reductase